MIKAMKYGLAAAATVTAPFSGAALADDGAGATAASSNTQITRSQELTALRLASDNSLEHAKEGFNVGLVLHVGDDITTAQVPIVADYYRDLYQTALDEKYPDQGGIVEVFPRPNPGTPASGFHANVGDGIFQVPVGKYDRDADADPSLMGLVTTREAIPDILEVLPAAKVQQAQNEAAATQTASLTSYSPTGLN